MRKGRSETSPTRPARGGQKSSGTHRNGTPAKRLLHRKTKRVFPKVRFRRHRFSKKSLASAGGHPFRRDSHLQRHRKTNRASKSRPCSRSGQRKKSHLHHRPVSQGNRFQRQTDRLCRRLGNQSLPVENRIRRRAFAATIISFRAVA